MRTSPKTFVSNWARTSSIDTRLDRTALAVAGVVDEHADGPLGVLDRVDRGAHRGLVRHVERQRLAAGCRAGRRSIRGDAPWRRRCSPSLASRSAVARPMPVEHPVMSTTCESAMGAPYPLAGGARHSVGDRETGGESHEYSAAYQRVDEPRGGWPPERRAQAARNACEGAHPGERQQGHGQHHRRGRRRAGAWHQELRYEGRPEETHLDVGEVAREAAPEGPGGGRTGSPGVPAASRSPRRAARSAWTPSHAR